MKASKPLSLVTLSNMMEAGDNLEALDARIRSSGSIHGLWGTGEDIEKEGCISRKAM